MELLNFMGVIMVNSTDPLNVNSNRTEFYEETNANVIEMIKSTGVALSSLQNVKDSIVQCGRVLSDLKAKLIKERRENLVYTPLFLLTCFSAGIYLGLKRNNW